MSFITELEKVMEEDVTELRKRFYEPRGGGWAGYVRKSWGPEGFVPRPRTYLAERQPRKEEGKNV